MTMPDNFQPMLKYKPIFPYDFTDLAEEVVRQHLNKEETSVDFGSLDRGTQEDLAIYILGDNDLKRLAKRKLNESAEDCSSDLIYYLVINCPEHARKAALDSYIGYIKNTINDYFRHRMDILGSEDTRKEREEDPDFWDKQRETL